MVGWISEFRPGSRALNHIDFIHPSIRLGCKLLKTLESAWGLGLNALPAV
jgi:hypothetical protein